jgi:hypothetical protein
MVIVVHRTIVSGYRGDAYPTGAVGHRRAWCAVTSGIGLAASPASPMDSDCWPASGRGCIGIGTDILRHQSAGIDTSAIMVWEDGRIIRKPYP